MNETKGNAEQSDSRIATVAELVRRLCTALVNCEMFPPGHPQTRDGVHRAFELLAGLFAGKPTPLVLSVSGTRLLIEGLPLEEKNPLVAKFAAKLADLHLNNLYFDPAITPEEFDRFFDVIGRGARYVNEHGGIQALLPASEFPHVGMRDVNYVMVRGDEKVVRMDARLSASDVPADDATTELARYVTSEILRKAEEQKWLIDEMRNNPSKVAELITSGVALATSRSEMQQGASEHAITALLNNIRLVGQSLVDTTTGEIKEGEETLEQSLLTLEKEVRLRTRQLTSSTVATGFVNEVLSLVTSYSDQVRAKRISNEFLKGETSLKRAEKFLRDFTPEEEDPRSFINRVRALITKRGVTGDMLDKALERVERQSAAPRPAKPRKPRKAFPKAVADGLEERLKGLDIEPVRMQEITESLGSFIEQRTRERAGQLLGEMNGLRATLERREGALDTLPWGVLLWDAEGTVEFANQAAKDKMGGSAPPVLSPAVRMVLANTPFPLAEGDGQALVDALGEADRAWVRDVVWVLRGDQGEVLGALLNH